jgi:ribonuclease HI
MSKIIKLYTDGACSGNPGPGGWGVVVYFDDGSVHELGGYDRATTNNRMEMQAAIDALNFFADCEQIGPCILYTDSEYLIKGITQWVKGWRKKGWKTAAGKPVLNQDLWESLDRLNQQIQYQTKVAVTWEYVRGHSGNTGNERCDEIARSFAARQSAQLRQRTYKLKPESSAPTETPAPVQKPAADLPSPMSEEHHLHHPEHADNLPREVRVAHLHLTIDTLRITDEIAKHGYLITSSELADLMDINASAVTSRGDKWAWRNWVVSRVRREGNQILWQLERVDGMNGEQLTINN